MKIFLRGTFVLSILFFLIQYHSALGQNIPKPGNEKKPVNNIKKEIKTEEAKELAKTAKFLEKLKKKLGIGSHIKAKQQKQIDAVIKKYVQDANLLSGADLKKVNDSLAKTTHLKIDSIGQFIFAINNENKRLSRQLDNLRNDVTSLSESMPEPAEELEMDKLVDKLIPMIKEKAKEEENKELRNKKINLIRLINAHPNGLSDTLPINDSTSKIFTLKLKKKEVFGFHPYWRNNDYYRNYNFSVLSSLIYSGYELDPKTGLRKNLHNWNKQEVTDYAKSRNCKVYLGVFCEKEEGIRALLASSHKQVLFFNAITEQLKLKNADGVNLIFGSPSGNNRVKFLNFVKALNNKLLAVDSNYKITLTVPVLDQHFFYDIKGLENDIAYFIIDFTKKNVNGPIVPIAGGDYSLESGLSRYLSFNVSPEKFIACLPYRGVVWNAESPDQFLGYIPYADIIEQYLDAGYSYDNNAATTEVVFGKRENLGKLWFDDAKTLSDKYDYILDKNLAGIGVWALGDDGFKNELWDALLDKLVAIDTTDVKEITHSPSLPKQLTIWQKIKREFRLYHELFQRPCRFESEFEYIDGVKIPKRELLKSDNYILTAVIVGMFLMLILGVYTIYMKRKHGDDWPYRKHFLVLLIILTVTNVLSLLMLLFLDEDFKAFGAQPGDDCDVKLTTLLKLLAIGFMLGGLATRFLLIPLLKRKDIP